MPVMDVDTALQTIGYGFGQVIIFIVCFFTYMYSVSEAMSVSYIVVLTSCEFATTAGEKTLLANSLLGGMVASGLFVGMLADKYGRKFTLRLALIGALGFSMLSALMPNLYALSITRMIVGLFLSAVASLQVAFLTEFHTPKWRPLAVTLCSQSQSMALIYCPLVAMAILPHHFTVTLSSQFDMRPWRFLMMAVEIPGWIALVGICLVPETPYFLLSINNGEKAILALKWICRKNRKNWEDFDIILAENERATVVPEGFFSSFLYDSFRLFRKPYFTKFFICLMLIFGLFFNSVGMGIWFPVIRNMDNSVSLRLCDLIKRNPQFASSKEKLVNGTETEVPPTCHDVMTNLIDPIYYGFSYMGCYILSTILLQCLLRKYVIATHIIVAFVLGLGLNVVKQPTMLLISYTLMITLPGVLIPLSTSVLIDFLPTHLRGKAICLVRSIARFGALLGSTLVGMLLKVSCDLTLNIFILYLAVCIVLALLLPE